MWARIQRRRAVFVEDVCRSFCCALGADPAGWDYSDFHGFSLPTAGPVMVGEYQMEARMFTLRGAAPSTLPLHSFNFQTLDESSGTQDFPPELATHARSILIQASIIQFLLFPLMILVRTFFTVYSWYLNLKHKLGRLGAGKGPPEHDPFLNALRALEKPQCRAEGHSLINDRHRCRIDLLEGVTPTLSDTPFWVFSFSVGAIPVNCHAVRLREIAKFFRLSPGTTVTGDENFHAGPSPARTFVRRWDGLDETRLDTVYIVQAPRAGYVFRPTTEQYLPTETHALLRAVVGSFRSEG
jgi:hypothetical protein